MSLRDYQRKWVDDIRAEWRAGNRVVVATMGTGGGKTVGFSALVREEGKPACLIAHRSELVSQAALTLNREGVPHGIVGPRELIREIVSLEMSTHGKSFYSPGALVRVAAVNTLAGRKHDPWMLTVGTVIIDEGHHLLRGGVWEKALEKFPACNVLAPTAHARRADGCGLGRNSDGLADALVIGPHSRALIEMGYLSDYRIVAPPSDINYDAVPIGASGDYSPARLSAVVHASNRIVGDVVGQYRKFAAGKLGLTFAVDVEAANELAAAYNALGVPAEVITGKTSISERAEIMRRFRARKLLQLVSVDVLGEGTDVPAVEVVSMARRTASWQLFCQQIGRALRVPVAEKFGEQWSQFTAEERRAHIAASDKPFGLILDHVGNFAWHFSQHGTPCSRQTYSLDRIDRRSRGKSDAIPLRTCLNESCYQPYPRTLIVCPHCGTPAPAPAGRAAPEQVDGDLVMLEPEALAALASDIARVDGPARVPVALEGPAAAAVKKRHLERQRAQVTLREAMALWGGWRAHVGESEREAQRRFFLQFGVDVLTCQTWGAREAAELEQRVRAVLNENGVIAA